jgi:chromosome segregation ATPase
LKKKILISVSIIVLIGLSGYLGYQLNKMSKAHIALSRDHQKLVSRADLLQKKYTEQKARTTALQRAKLSAEGFQRQAEMKVEEIKKQMDAQAAEMQALEKKAIEKTKVLEERITARDRALEKWKESHATLTEKLREARTTINKRDSAIAALEENKQELESELEFTKRTRDRYLTENKEMAETSKSILARYDEKGIFSETIMPVEPFTQIKKVELEKLIQAYLDNIDNKTIRDGE